jgi:hypothetical protein
MSTGSERVRWSGAGRAAVLAAPAVIASAQLGLATVQAPDRTSSTGGPAAVPLANYPGAASTPPTPYQINSNVVGCQT